MKRKKNVPNGQKPRAPAKKSPTRKISNLIATKNCAKSFTHDTWVFPPVTALLQIRSQWQSARPGPLVTGNLAAALAVAMLIALFTSLACSVFLATLCCDSGALPELEGLG